MKTIGFLGGSFDPIHFGHIHLALEMQERFYLDEILFCPAFCSPFKTAAPPLASPEHRLEMVRLAIADIPGCTYTDVEVTEKRPSFTIDTLRKLQKPSVQYRLILSEEAAKDFGLWKESGELIRLAPPLIGTRHSTKRLGPLAQEKGWCETKIIEISSTEIRQRWKRGLYCGHLVPHRVIDYMRSHHLYD